MYKWLLPTMSEVLALGETAWVEANLEFSLEALQAPADLPADSPNRASYARQLSQAEREWTAAIAALNDLLDSLSTTSKTSKGLVLSGPSPILNCQTTPQFSTWVFTPQSLTGGGGFPLQLLPAEGDRPHELAETAAALPLLPVDPLATEQFCLVSTTAFSLLVVLGENADGKPLFLYSFDPEVVRQAWRSLRPRVLLTGAHQISRIDALFEQFSPVAPHYHTVTQFSRLLLHHLQEVAEDTQRSHTEHSSSPEVSVPFADSQNRQDIELVQAIAHEVRTPLTTIRTLVRSLLRRKDLAPEVLKRLEMVDRECSEQIDRFSLIFKAVELESSVAQQTTMPLTATPIDRVLQASIPRWQQQAQQRNLALEVVLPQQIPTVVSDPTMLDQALTGLIERFTRSLPSGSHIQVQVTLAGDRLKLEFQAQMGTQCPESTDSASQWPTLKALGQLLTFQPETGILSLNMAVTKNLFQALGGKLIVRQRPQQGEVFTIFLPLEVNNPDIRTV
ncbi:MAG: HAMP domain-containing sensor histidine kinase [Leptolyngbyaceae cyanobacterium bins.59]|nr:HAMP domain-containing sensor histidine kinase [Leptolyngbyaceae cyanobacterium bins.59]